jgi:hypothetical protein
MMHGSRFRVPFPTLGFWRSWHREPFAEARILQVEIAHLYFAVKQRSDEESLFLFD